MRAVEAGEFEIALSRVDELDDVAGIRRMDDVYRELATHSIENGLIDQAISFVKIAERKSEVANCVLRFVSQDNDDAAFEYLRKLQRVSPQLALTVTSRFIGSRTEVDTPEISAAQNNLRKIRAMKLIRSLEEDFSEFESIGLRVVQLNSKDLDVNEKQKILTELEEFFRHAPSEQVAKRWFVLTEGFSVMNRLDLLEAMAGHDDEHLAGAATRALVSKLVERGRLDEAKKWLVAPCLKAKTAEEFFQMTQWAVSCGEIDLIDNYIDQRLEMVLGQMDTDQLTAPLHSAERLFRAAVTSREKDRRSTPHSLPLQMKILTLIGYTNFSDPQPLMLFLDELGELASEHYWLQAELNKFMTSDKFVDFFIDKPTSIQCLLSIAENVPTSLIVKRNQRKFESNIKRVFELNIKQAIARSMNAQGRTDDATAFVLKHFHLNRNMTETFGLDWKDTPPSVLKFLYERAPESPENMMYGIYWHQVEGRPEGACLLAEQFCSSMLEMVPDERNIGLMYQTVGLFSAEWFEKILPLLENAEKKAARPSLALLMVDNMVRTGATEKLLQTSRFIENDFIRVMKLFEAVEELAPRRAAKLEHLFHQIENPRRRKRDAKPKRNNKN